MPPLASKKGIVVFAKNAPTFGYEVICEAKLTVKGSFVSKDLEGYKGRAATIAQKCGAKYAIVEGMDGFSYRGSSSLWVDIKVVRKTTDESPFGNMYYSDRAKYDKELKKIVSAASVSNIKNLKLLLENNKFVADKAKRPPIETRVLTNISQALTAKGEFCATKSLRFLSREYGIKLKGLGKEEYEAARTMECPAKIVTSSVLEFEDKLKSITTINNVITEMLNSGFTSNSKKNAYRNYKQMYSSIMKEVNTSCEGDSTSQLCSLRPNLKKVYTTIKKMKL